MLAQVRGRVRYVLTCLAGAVGGLADPIWSAQESPGSGQAAAIKVQSSLVVVDLISRDVKTGLPIRDFHKEDFLLFDNGREVTIASFDGGADARPAILWLVVLCNEQNKTAGSADYAGKEAMFRPALEHLDARDLMGVAHWCDNGETALDLPPTTDRDAPTRVLAETIKPIAFRGETAEADAVGEVTFRKMVRLIIQDAHRRKPEPLPVIVFLDGDHTGQPKDQLDLLVNDFLETSGIVFGIKDSRYGRMLPLIGEQGQILHYMAKHTGGEYLVAAPEGYAAALEQILMQLHYRYQIGFVPPAIDGKRHQLKVEFTNEARRKYKGVRLRFRLEYIPVAEAPEWAR